MQFLLFSLAFLLLRIVYNVRQNVAVDFIAPVFIIRGELIMFSDECVSNSLLYPDTLCRSL